jgi:hypothetical protein
LTGRPIPVLAAGPAAGTVEGVAGTAGLATEQVGVVHGDTDSCVDPGARGYTTS